MPPSIIRNIGDTSPYSGRGAYESSKSTDPVTPTTRRSRAPTAVAPSSWPRSLRPTASASVSVSEPLAVVNVVSSIMVSSKYRRVVSNDVPSGGEIVQYPAASSRRRPNTDGPSKRGKHSQSIDPPRLTSAAERQSDSRA